MRTLTLLCALAAVLLLGCTKETTVTKVEPSTGNVAGNDTVVIYGSGMKTGMTVHFGRRQAQVVVIEAGARIRVKTPSGAEGPVDVIVTDENGKTFVLKEGFRYHSQVGK